MIYLKKTKKIFLNLHYYKSKTDIENGIYIGGVVDPKYLNELTIDVNDDYDFDMNSDQFIKNGLYSIEIIGSNRALKEFGKFLINMAMFKTQDNDYHEHIDLIRNNIGVPSVNLTIRKKT